LANSENSQNGLRTKHMDMWLHFVQEHVQSKLSTLFYIKSSENPADFLNKSVGRCTIWQSLKVLGIYGNSDSALHLTTQSTDACWNSSTKISPQRRGVSVKLYT
jgi:hypothetical protein